MSKKVSTQSKEKITQLPKDIILIRLENFSILQVDSAAW